MAFGSAAVLPESTEDFSINAFAQQSEVILPTGDVRLPQAVEIELPQGYTLSEDAKQKLDASFSAEDSLVRRTLSPYVYKCLSNYKNGCMLQRFYNDLVDAIEDMWYTSGDLKENDLGLSEDKKYLRMVGYSKYGLSKYEAMTIFNFMSISCPMSFYIKETYYNFTNGSLGFVPKDEYVSGEERTSWNNKVMQYIKSYDSVLKGKTTMYQKALAVHDELVRRIEYAFIPNWPSGYEDAVLYEHGYNEVTPDGVRITNDYEFLGGVSYSSYGIRENLNYVDTNLVYEGLKTTGDSMAYYVKPSDAGAPEHHQSQHATTGIAVLCRQYGWLH